ncbi:DUF2851 family protein [Salinimicrobium sp. CAU 1759]
MREDYLHYLWQFQKFNNLNLKTVEGKIVQVISPGLHNELSGPDFFNARLLIGEQEWAGNVEIHLRSSDWYLHGHETDPAYDNVILHVVWIHDVEIFRKNNSPLPVIALKDVVSSESLLVYQKLCADNSLRWISCQEDFSHVDDFLLNNWLERLYVERLEKRSSLIEELLVRAAGDWEAVLFQMLARNFGLNVNGEAFLSIAASIPFSAIRKVNLLQMESLLLGQAGLLTNDHQEPYFRHLKEEYLFLKHKFKLSSKGVLPVKYFRLRPDNFPEIRLVQLAAVYYKQKSLFSSLQKCKNTQQVYELFNANVSEFWNSHYTFSRSHSPRKKKLSFKLLDLLIINTVVPVQFCYIKSTGKEEFEGILPLIKSIAPERNEVVKKFETLRPSVAPGAMETQALLQLKNEYCDKKACLKCAVGMKILQQQPQI